MKIEGYLVHDSYNMARTTNSAYFRAPTEAEFNKYASNMDYDNGYDMYIDDALRSKSEAIRNHARTIIFAHLYGIDEVYPLTGEPVKTKHLIDGVEYEEELGYSGRIGKYDTRRSFPSFACFIYEHGWRVGVFDEQGFHV
jgi:hypothetical protein